MNNNMPELVPFSGMTYSPSAEPLKANKIALHDADWIKYFVTARISKKLKADTTKGRYEIFLKEDPALTETKSILDDLFSKIKDPIIFCFSGNSQNTFRASLAFDKVYKGNRKKDYDDYEDKYKDIETCMKYINDNFVTLVYKDLEADDIVAALQCENTYIISKDKDLKQVPGFHYDFDTNKIFEISKDQALYNLAYQLLAGDSTDNISGLPGCGPKGAIQALSGVKPTSYLKKVLHEYQLKFGVFEGTDMFAEAWMLIKMRSSRGNNFMKKYKGMFDLKESILNELKLKKS